MRGVEADPREPERLGELSLLSGMRRLLLRLARKPPLLLDLCRLKLLHVIYGIEGVAQATRYVRDPQPILKAYGARIGEGTRIYPGLMIHGARKDFANLRVGSHARIVRDCLLDLTDTITIGDEAIISLRCSLITHQNVFRSPLVELGYRPAHGPITISPGAVVFANATILMGVTIGECAMVAAGAVVLSDVPPWTLVGGVPAKVLKELRPNAKDSVLHLPTRETTADTPAHGCSTPQSS